VNNLKNLNKSEHFVAYSFENHKQLLDAQVFEKQEHFSAQILTNSIIQKEGERES
jgi:hypothetical protein